MRFFIFLLDTFIITVIANAIVEWRYRYHPSKGYFQMLYTCGIWLLFMYALQFAHLYRPLYVKGILSVPLMVTLLFGKRYLQGKWRDVRK